MIAVADIKPHTKKISAIQRLDWVDYARGVAIIFVVFRHTMVGLYRSDVAVPGFLYQIQEFTVNFRMPVFFMLSGIFLSRAMNKNSQKNNFKKKAGTLLYPYLLWTFIFISFQILFSDYTNASRTAYDYLNILLQPRKLDHMWYLLALFTTSSLYILSYSYIKKRVVQLTAGIILHFLSFWLKEYSLFSDLCYYYIFLILGVYISDALLLSQHQNKKNFLKYTLLILPLFLTGQLYWLNYAEDNFYIMPLALVIILIACIFFYYFCRWAREMNIATFLITIGRHSLYIYILHILVISGFRILCVKFLSVDNPYFLVSGSLALGILIPILAYKSLNKYGFDKLFAIKSAS